MAAAAKFDSRDDLVILVVAGVEGVVDTSTAPPPVIELAIVLFLWYYLTIEPPLGCYACVTLGDVVVVLG